MTALSSLYTALAARLDTADWLLPTLARFLFAAILLVYFLNSGLTKIDGGPLSIFSPALNAYAQIFPNAMLAVSYDITQLSAYHHAVVIIGTVTEFILPALIVLGFLTRLAALGMIGFIVVQSLTDLVNPDVSGVFGAWFDRAPDAVIMDQRALWIFLLLVLVIKGAGPISFDRALKSRGE